MTLRKIFNDLPHTRALEIINGLFKAVDKAPLVKLLRSFFPYERHGNPEKKTAYIYSLVAAVSLLFSWQLYEAHGDFLLSGEQWAEAATSYFFKARHEDFQVKYLFYEAGYLPIVGRLIAAFSHDLGISAANISYIYNFSAVILGIAVIVCFISPVFRPIVPSDELRAGLALYSLWLIDFQTITFINFSHMAWLPCAGFICLAMFSHDQRLPKKLPWWSWPMALFILSKPYYTTLAPAMLLAFLIGKGRYRVLMFVWLVAIGIQFVTMLSGYEAGGIGATNKTGFTLGEKLLSVVGHSGGLLGAMPMGPLTAAKLINDGQIILPILIAVMLFSVFLWLAYRYAYTRPLIITGFCLFFMTFLINSFALAAGWNINFIYLTNYWIYRHVLSAYIGFGVLLVALLYYVDREWLRKKTAVFWRFVPVGVAAFWFIYSGWAHLGHVSLKWPSMPYQDASRWQQLSPYLDKDLYPLCIPVNPYPWRVQLGCSLLNEPDVPAVHNIHLYNDFNFTISATRAAQGLDLKLLPNINKEAILGIGFILKRLPDQPVDTVYGHAVATLEDGSSVAFAGHAKLKDQALLYLAAPIDNHVVRKIRSVRVRFSRPVTFMSNAATAREPIVLWYGAKKGLRDLATHDIHTDR